MPKGLAQFQRFGLVEVSGCRNNDAVIFASTFLGDVTSNHIAPDFVEITG